MPASVSAHRVYAVTNLNDALECAQFRRWVGARPERRFGTHEAAVTFVQVRPVIER